MRLNPGGASRCMKVILAYRGPNKKFNEEHSVLVKIQIDNSLDLSWKNKDILLVTDFPYKYNGIKSLVIGDGFYYDFDLTSNKVPIIRQLFHQGFIKQGELYWCHDFDVYQLEAISEEELGLDDYDLGLTPYGYKPEWNMGSLFFKESARDIFNLLHEDILTRRKSNNRCEEKALKRLIIRRVIGKERYKDLNVTYNLTKRCIATNYRTATKPLKAIHFHPWDKDAMMSDTALNMFMYGKNRLKKPLMTDRLIKIFNHHGIK